MKNANTRARPVGSLLFYLGYFLSMGIVGIPMALLSLCVSLPWRFRLLNVHNRFVLFWLRVTCGICYQIEGRENLPGKDVAYVMVANHQSEWETIYLQTLQPPLCTVLKQELLNIPVFGWSLRLLHPIPLDRSQPAKMLRKLLKIGSQRIEEGLAILIFPQGTRVLPGQSKPFSKGAAMIACRTGAPLVPVAHNAGRHWTRKGWIKYSGTLQLRIGPPLATEGKTPDEVTRLAEDWINQQLTEIDQTSVS